MGQFPFPTLNGFQKLCLQNLPALISRGSVACPWLSQFASALPRSEPIFGVPPLFQKTPPRFKIRQLLGDLCSANVRWHKWLRCVCAFGTKQEKSKIVETHEMVASRVKLTNRKMSRATAEKKREAQKTMKKLSLTNQVGEALIESKKAAGPRSDGDGFFVHFCLLLLWCSP